MLKVGDVVSLKSGSHSMTVVKELNSTVVRVAWFVEGMPVQHELPIEALKKHD